MERGSDKGAGPDEEDGDQAHSWTLRTDRSERGEVEMSTCHGGEGETSADTGDARLWGGPVYYDQEKAKREPEATLSSGVISGGHAGVLETEREEITSDPSASPISLMDTCCPSMSSLSSASYSSNHVSSSSSVLSLTPPLPASVELSAVLTDVKLTLDVYQGGAAALPLLWSSIPEQLRGIQYLRLSSEDKPQLDGALDILPHLKELRSLTIRGHRFYDSQGDPLPGLLTTLPTTFSSLSHLVHLDLSFNQLSHLPSSLFSISSLSSLHLGHNRISVLPPEIGLLSSLTYLSLLGNQLVSLTPGLGQLKRLQTLDVSHNCLQHLPDEIGSLEGLVKLYLSHNMLKQLPETMGKGDRALSFHSGILLSTAMTSA